MAHRRAASTLAAALSSIALTALVAVVVIERAHRRIEMVQFTSQEYINWLADLERTEGDGKTVTFANDLTPASVIEMPLGTYRPEYRCGAAVGCSGAESQPRDPASYNQYMEVQWKKLQEKKKLLPKYSQDGPSPGLDDHPFDLPTSVGMQEKIRRLFDGPEQCPPCQGARRRLLSGGCGCY